MRLSSASCARCKITFQAKQQAVPRAGGRGQWHGALADHSAFRGGHSVALAHNDHELRAAVRAAVDASFREFPFLSVHHLIEYGVVATRYAIDEKRHNDRFNRGRISN